LSELCKEWYSGGSTLNKIYIEYKGFHRKKKYRIIKIRYFFSHKLFACSFAINPIFIDRICQTFFATHSRISSSTFADKVIRFPEVRLSFRHFSVAFLYKSGSIL